MPPKILVISGPTASGKTALAVELALRHNGEVVSADSMQIYRRMDIGTAKPTHEEMEGVPHHMLDVAEPEENFSVARYVDMAALTDDCFFKDDGEKSALQKAAQEDFDRQMDGFLAFLRAARDAVKRWPVKK